jgi:hypothetical protein
MENLVIGIIVLVVGYVVYNKFIKKDESVPAPSPAKTPAPAPAPKKAVVKKAEVKKVPTKTVLNKMTKKELDNFAKVEFGVKLDARLKKDEMIKAFQKEAKAK